MLRAHRSSSSAVTEYTPYSLPSVHNPTITKHKLLSGQTGSGLQLLAKRLDEINLAFWEAARWRVESWFYNMRWLQQRVNAGEMNFDDNVYIRAYRDNMALDLCGPLLGLVSDLFIEDGLLVKLARIARVPMDSGRLPLSKNPTTKRDVEGWKTHLHSILTTYGNIHSAECLLLDTKLHRFPWFWTDWP